MAYLGDPREDRIDIYTGNNAGIGAGVIWESGGQKEQRFMWNGAWYDMCNLGAQEDGSVDTDQWKVLYHVVIENGTTPSGKTKVTITPSYKWEGGNLSLFATASKAVEENVTLTFVVNGANQTLVMSKGSTSAKVENLEYAEEPTVSTKVSIDKTETENQVLTVNTIKVTQKAYLKYGWVAYNDISEIADEKLLSGVGISGVTCNLTDEPELLVPQPYDGQVAGATHFYFVWGVSGSEIQEISENGNGYISGTAVEKKANPINLDGKSYIAYILGPQDIVAENEADAIDYASKFKITFSK